MAVNTERFIKSIQERLKNKNSIMAAVLLLGALTLNACGEETTRTLPSNVRLVKLITTTANYRGYPYLVNARGIAPETLDTSEGKLQLEQFSFDPNTGAIVKADVNLNNQEKSLQVIDNGQIDIPQKNKDSNTGEEYTLEGSNGDNLVNIVEVNNSSIFVEQQKIT